jgi:hypothetical protein
MDRTRIDMDNSPMKGNQPVACADSAEKRTKETDASESRPLLDFKIGGFSILTIVLSISLPADMTHL